MRRPQPKIAEIMKNAALQILRRRAGQGVNSRANCYTRSTKLWGHMSMTDDEPLGSALNAGRRSRTLVHAKWPALRRDSAGASPAQVRSR
jgi:hypothetical protein